MKILCIQTGGTIDKDYPKTSKGYAFEITEPAVERIFFDANPSFEYRIESLLKKDSMDITQDDREQIARFCENAEEKKILITHGTDTMHKTAERLNEIKSKTIVITGAMRPERFSNSDADFNIGIALGALQSLDHVVYIAMHGLVLPWREMSRNYKTGQFIQKA